MLVKPGAYSGSSALFTEGHELRRDGVPAASRRSRQSLKRGCTGEGGATDAAAVDGAAGGDVSTVPQRRECGCGVVWVGLRQCPARGRLAGG